MKKAIKVLVLCLLICLCIGSINVFADDLDIPGSGVYEDFKIECTHDPVVGEAFEVDLHIENCDDLSNYKIKLSKNIIFDESYYPFEYTNRSKERLLGWAGDYSAPTDVGLHLIALKKGKASITISNASSGYKYTYTFKVNTNNLTGDTFGNSRGIVYLKRVKNGEWIGLSKLSKKVINYAIKTKSLTKALKKYNTTAYIYIGLLEDGLPGFCGGEFQEYGYYGDPDGYYDINNIEDGLFNGYLTYHSYSDDDCTTVEYAYGNITGNAVCIVDNYASD